MKDRVSELMKVIIQTCKKYYLVTAMLFWCNSIGWEVSWGVEGQATGPLRVSSRNPRYFEDPTGRVIYLTGSHTWGNFQDNGGVVSHYQRYLNRIVRYFIGSPIWMNFWGSNIRYPPPVFDYAEYLDWLRGHRHNFFRLWAWEQSRWATDTADDTYWFHPGPPYLRTGPENALDGRPKFDLTQLDPAFFSRLRDRAIEAGQRGVYVSIMLFDGWSIEMKGGVAANNPWKGHPFNLLNNINGTNGDANNDGSGSEVHTLNIPAVTALQEAYVQRVVDAVNDLDNVLYEISNESHDDSQEWQYHMIQFIKNYEATKLKQHPVGMTVEWPNGNNYELFNSPADWISPNIDYSSTAVDGRKVIISDTDHICGVCRDGTWVWRTFMMGGNPIFMDVYDGTGYGTGAGDANFETDRPGFVSARRSMGQTLDYAKRINLAHMTPRPDITSTGYALAYPAPKGAEFLVYRLSGSTPISVDLSATQESLSIEWFNPVDGTISSGDVVKGGTQRSFTPPFAGEVVLYLKSESDDADKVLQR